MNEDLKNVTCPCCHGDAKNRTEKEAENVIYVMNGT